VTSLPFRVSWYRSTALEDCSVCSTQKTGLLGEVPNNASETS
jgi:hypothetical protein